MANVLDREEQIEQAYFFRTMRERVEEKLPTQEILERIHEEILSTTRLPMAIQFLATEIKHTGLLSSGFDRLLHYFTPFQAFVMRQTEDERTRFSLEIGLLILEREAQYRAVTPTQPGLFVYQFEAISRNRLGYDAGLKCVQEDAFFDADWKAYVGLVRRQVGAVDFSDLVYLRSELYVIEQRRRDPDYAPPLPALFGEKEGKIARQSGPRSAVPVRGPATAARLSRGAARPRQGRSAHAAPGAARQDPGARNPAQARRGGNPRPRRPQRIHGPPGIAAAARPRGRMMLTRRGVH